MASDIPNLKEENMLLLGNGSYSAKHYMIESPFYMRCILAFNMQVTFNVCGFPKCLR